MSRALAIVALYVALMAVLFVALTACAEPPRKMDWKALTDYLAEQERAK